MSPLPAQLFQSPEQYDAIPPENVILVFDWDDTLLCTTALTTGDLRESECREVEQAARETLEAAKSLADTRIVTNSVAHWVQESTLRYMPSLLTTLQRMHIVSARSCYEDVWPAQPVQWKLQAFKEALRGKLNRCQGTVCVVSVGDSNVDIESAAKAVELLGDRLILKTVKLKDRPTAKELVRQLQQIQDGLVDFVRAPGPMGVSLSLDGTNAMRACLPAQAAEGQRIALPAAVTPSTTTSSLADSFHPGSVDKSPMFQMDDDYSNWLSTTAGFEDGPVMDEDSIMPFSKLPTGAARKPLLRAL